MYFNDFIPSIADMFLQLCDGAASVKVGILLTAGTAKEKTSKTELNGVPDPLGLA